MFAAAVIAILVTMLVALIRGFIGPSVYDRVLAANLFGTKTVLLIATYGFLSGRPDFLDIALVYALINFIGVIAILKYFEYGGLHHSELPETQAGQAQSIPEHKTDSPSSSSDNSGNTGHKNG